MHSHIAPCHTEHSTHTEQSTHIVTISDPILYALTHCTMSYRTQHTYRTEHAHSHNIWSHTVCTHTLHHVCILRIVLKMVSKNRNMLPTVYWLTIYIVCLTEHCITLSYCITQQDGCYRKYWFQLKNIKKGLIQELKLISQKLSTLQC